MICAPVPLKEVVEFELGPGEPDGWKLIRTLYSAM